MKKALFMIALFSVLFSQKIFAQEDVTVFFRGGSRLIGTLSKTDENGRMQVITPCGTVVNFTEKSVEEIIYDDNEPAVKRSFRKVATVYLRNGSILKGRLTELDNGNRFRIETANGSSIYFSEKSVKEMDVEELERPVTITRQRRYSDEMAYEEPVDLLGNGAHGRPYL